MSGFDWPSLMRIGLHQMGLHPDEFWGLTPLEFMIIAGLEGRKSAVMTRADLKGLCARFPDTEPDTETE
ncbi:MAG: phage tail assembly chaperone [Proteobacteria bacterium]|nr:phage tail assembly chaperone [Pseudomonadota bacterium]